MLGRQFKDDGPHLVYVPEVVFDEQAFVRDVLAINEKLGRCVVAVSEGVHDAAGTTVAEKLAARSERDSYGNVQLSGSGALGDHLAGLIKAALPKSRVRSDTFGYLQRSFAGCFSETDAEEARLVGREAVRFALKETGGTIVLKRVPGPRYKCIAALAPLDEVAKVTRGLERRYINKAGTTSRRLFRITRRRWRGRCTRWHG